MNEVELKQLKKMLLRMNTKEQLEVSQLLLDELYEKSETFGWKKKNFEAERVDKVVYLLTLYVSNLENRVKRDEMLSALERIEALPENKKKRVISAAFSEAKRIEKEDRQRQAEEDCRREGHIFKGKYGGWTSREYSSFEKICPGDHIVYEDWVEHTEWSRTCTRCGVVESMVDKEPEAVSKAKEKVKRKERIAELEKELADLKKRD